jgi:hypothetical protein
MKFSDVFADVTSREGIASVAEELGLSDSQIGGIKNDERGICLKKIDQFMERYGYTVILKAREDEFITSTCLAWSILQEKIKEGK